MGSGSFKDTHKPSHSVCTEANSELGQHGEQESIILFWATGKQDLSCTVVLDKFQVPLSLYTM